MNILDLKLKNDAITEFENEINNIIKLDTIGIYKDIKEYSKRHLENIDNIQKESYEIFSELYSKEKFEHLYYHFDYFNFIYGIFSDHIFISFIEFYGDKLINNILELGANYNIEKHEWESDKYKELNFGNYDIIGNYFNLDTDLSEMIGDKFDNKFTMNYLVGLN
jgi:hypothetical protein